MKLFFIYLTLALAAASSLSLVCHAQTGPNTAVPQAPAAVPNGVLTDPYAAILGPEVKLLGYSIRPPKDYTPMSMPPQTGSTRSFAWQGAIHQDGSVTTFVVGIVRPAVAEKNPAREFMTGAFQGLSSTLTNSAMSPSQPGVVGGMPAQRATWTGTRETKHTKLTMQGFIYVVQDGAILISIIGTDSVPSFTTTFSVLNSSALSLHR